jgi:hypothetical protein
MTKCKDCGSDQAYDFYSRKGNKGTCIWLCLDCLQKRIKAPGNLARTEAYEEITEFLDEGGKLN